jgi:stage II sporulation protein R
MKTKTIVKLYVLILSLGTILSLYIPKTEVTADEPMVIPSEAIRLRILANSDYEEDQELKRKVRDAVNAEITEWVSELTSIEDARNLIQSRLPEIQKIAEEVVEEEGSDQKVNADFGKVSFPTKLYGQFLYPAGEYEAILITLGEGKGTNWWCVLFPPLCFLDFSNGVAVSEGFEEGDKKGEVKAQEEVAAASADSKKEPKEDSPPVYTEEDEQPVEVKFFLVEIWEKIFG